MAAMMLYLLVSQVAAFVPPLTGNVPVDFPSTEPGVVVAAGGGVVLFQGNLSGWIIYDVRFAYDTVSDTAFFGTPHASGVAQARWAQA